MTQTRRPRPAVKGWKARSILFHRYMTKSDSPMRARGLFPAHARHALDATLAVGYLLGLSKKHWRDGEERPLTLEAVQKAREATNAALDRLEDEIRNPTTPDENEKALESYARHGLIGLLAIGLVEEACEAAEPIAQIADGTSTYNEVRREVEDELYDVRMYHAMVDDAFNIDINMTAQRKNDETLARHPEAADAALSPEPLNAEQISQSMKSILSQGRKNP